MDGKFRELVVIHSPAQPFVAELRTSQETTGVQCFSREEIEGLQMSDFNRQRVDDAFADQPVTFVRKDFYPL